MNFYKNFQYTRCVNNKLVTRHKGVIRDTTGLLFSDWSKITFIFRSYPKCGKVVMKSEVGKFR